MKSARQFKYLSGMRYGRLLVGPMSGFSSGGHRMWDCLCDCGKLRRVAAHQLLGGKTKSCGCLIADSSRSRATVHGELLSGKPRTPEYNAWKNMRARCYNKARREYARYGGRGIEVCERWSSFAAFVADMGRRPGPGYSLERKDNDGWYTPDNCIWGTAKQQCRNRQTTKTVEFRGEAMSLAEAAERAGLPYAVVCGRFYRLKWSIEDALTRPHRFEQKREVRL